MSCESEFAKGKREALRDGEGMDEFFAATVGTLCPSTKEHQSYMAGRKEGLDERWRNGPPSSDEEEDSSDETDSYSYSDGGYSSDSSESQDSGGEKGCLIVVLIIVMCLIGYWGSRWYFGQDSHSQEKPRVGMFLCPTEVDVFNQGQTILVRWQFSKRRNGVGYFVSELLVLNERGEYASITGVNSFPGTDGIYEIEWRVGTVLDERGNRLGVVFPPGKYRLYMKYHLQDGGDAGLRSFASGLFWIN